MTADSACLSMILGIPFPPAAQWEHRHRGSSKRLRRGYVYMFLASLYIGCQECDAFNMTQAEYYQHFFLFHSVYLGVTGNITGKLTAKTQTILTLNTRGKEMGCCAAMSKAFQTLSIQRGCFTMSAPCYWRDAQEPTLHATLLRFSHIPEGHSDNPHVITDEFVFQFSLPLQDSFVNCCVALVVIDNSF
ncbi:hypothetical protein RRG08_018001 [Elysia crispata]|uniref:Uncharacterized protein n=1 Tax=Elysia crispata TaxID=231223 RepID=A0AAE1DDX6_9GAST|nr:hypothetical protein RRG08_018001 [Elysia crispata]